MQVSNKTYDFLNDTVKVGLPAIGTLYFGLAQIWGFPYGEAVVGTLALVATALGVWLKILKRDYEPPTDGVVDIDASDPSHARVLLALDNDDVFAHKDGDTVTLKIMSNVDRI